MSGSFVQALLMDDPDGTPVPVPTCSPDPYWDDTKVLLHFDGIGSPHTFTDEKGNTWVRDDANRPDDFTLSTAKVRFGDASLLMRTTTGTSSSFTLSATDAGGDYSLGTGNKFTLEGWVYIQSGSLKSRVSVCEALDAAAGTVFGIRCGGADLGELNFYTSLDVEHSELLAIPQNDWVHVAMTYDGTTKRTYINETLQNATALSAGPEKTIRGYKILGIVIGSEFVQPAYLDEVRLTAGVARYTGTTFTTQTLPFCSGTVDPGAPSVSGTELLTGQALTAGQGLLRVADPWVKLVGSAATASAGSVAIFDPNRSVALTGQQLRVASGTTFRPRFPELTNTAPSPGFSASGTTTTAYVQIEFLADGSYSVRTPTTFTAPYGFWIYNPFSFYAIADIAHLYRVSSVALIANGGFVIQSVAANMASTSTFLIQNSPAASSLYVEFVVTITPTDPSMESMGPFAAYQGTHRFRILLTKT